jgi:deoxyribonuclease-4
MGICLDTAIYTAQDMILYMTLTEYLKRFDSIVGIKYLKALHINDSANPFNSRKDRHAKLGEGLSV